MKKIIFALCMLAGTQCLAANSFLGPIARFQLNSPLADENATGIILLEGGPRDARFNGTLGYDFSPQHHVDLSGEYLTQKNSYPHVVGNHRKWANQTAGGLKYYYAFDNFHRSLLNIGGWIAHTANVSDSTVVTPTFTDFRNVAGSNAGGVSPGVTLHPWLGGETSLALNWDTATYTTKFAPHVQAEGFGVTGNYKQQFVHNLQLDLMASSRAIFDNYKAEFDCMTQLSGGQLITGVFYNYTHGKKALPNASVVGLNVRYDINDVNSIRSQHASTQWIAEPAVLMPEVLAIPEDAIA